MQSFGKLEEKSFSTKFWFTKKVVVFSRQLFFLVKMELHNVPYKHLVYGLVAVLLFNVRVWHFKSNDATGFTNTEDTNKWG